MKVNKSLKTEEKLRKVRLGITILAWVLMAGLILLVGLLYLRGYLTDADKLESFIDQTGSWGPLVFLFIQVLQVLVPILPGGVTTFVGVAVFGPIWGFIWNYLSTCLGSLIAFAIAKRFGRRILEAFFSPKTIANYEHRTDSDSRFAVYFAWAILLPFFPDDLLCYLAGTTEMSYTKFITIILLAKPASILLYSLSAAGIWSFFS